jgi:hypothetical protein
MRKYTPSRLSFRCFDPVSLSIHPSLISSRRAALTARSDIANTRLIQEAFTVPTPLTSPFFRSRDKPRRRYAKQVFISAGFVHRARKRSTRRGTGIGRVALRLSAVRWMISSAAGSVVSVNVMALSENRSNPTRSSCLSADFTWASVTAPSRRTSSAMR